MSDQPPHPQYPPPYYPAQPAFAEPPAPDGRPLANPGQRLGARVVDGIIGLIVTLVLAGVIAGGTTGLVTTLVPDDSPLIPITAISLIVLVALGVQYVYEVEIPLRWNGQTPGKRMLKIAVIAMEPHAPLRRGALTYRFLVLMGFNLLSNCYVGMIDPLWCLWDKPYRQCLHDKPAKTVVIRLQNA